MAGVRFVRNQMHQQAGLADFAGPPAGGCDRETGAVTAWTWKAVPEPILTSLPRRGQEWEMSRYRAYSDCLAGRTIGEVFGRATAFLAQAAATAGSVTSADTPALR